MTENPRPTRPPSPLISQPSFATSSIGAAMSGGSGPIRFLKGALNA